MAERALAYSEKIHGFTSSTDTRMDNQDPPEDFFKDRERSKRFQVTTAYISGHFFRIMKDLGIENAAIQREYKGNEGFLNLSPGRKVEYNLHFKEGEKDQEWESKEHRVVSLNYTPGGGLRGKGDDELYLFLTSLVVPSNFRSGTWLPLEEAKEYMESKESTNVDIGTVFLKPVTGEGILDLITLGLADSRIVPSFNRSLAELIK